MNDLRNIKHRDDYDDEVTLRELIFVLWKGKRIIISITAFITIVGIIYSLFLPNIYESKALLVPVNSSSAVSSALQGYSGLVGLAGINLPSGSDEGNSLKAIQKISSLSFFENNIQTNIFLPDLMALESWNNNTNTLSYDESKYNVSNNRWVRDFSPPQQQIPSAQESFEAFVNKHLGLIEDKNTGFITLSIRHQSPFIAKEWAELVISEVNDFYRQKDKSESERAVKYLNQQISMTDLSEIKQVIAQLLQEETKKLTLIEANQSYVFDYIDPPAVMEQRVEPRRSLIFILSLLFGVSLSTLIVLIKHYVFAEKAP